MIDSESDNHIINDEKLGLLKKNYKYNQLFCFNVPYQFIDDYTSIDRLIHIYKMMNSQYRPQFDRINPKLKHGKVKENEKIRMLLRNKEVFPLQRPVHIGLIGDKYYIYNANIIRFNESKQDFKGITFYASHCPIYDRYRGDIDLFLKMLIDNEIHFVCIPAEFEDDIVKSYLWFPTTENKTIRYSNKCCEGIKRNCDYELTCISKRIWLNDSQDIFEDKALVYKYKICVLDKINQINHTINILHFENWHNSNLNFNINYISLFMSLSFTSTMATKNKKVLVHSSGGAGRTGIMIAAMEILYLKLTANDSINHLLMEIIMYMKQFRTKWFQQETDFILLHKALHNLLNS